MVSAANLGFPRIGPKRELKKAVESFWSNQSTEKELLEVASKLRASAWQKQKDAGIDIIPSNDFSFYDHVLDTISLVGAVPQRYQWKSDQVDLNTYFMMARGSRPHQATNRGALIDAPAMEMTKWFDTNYHFIVPELDEISELKLASNKYLDEFLEAKALGILTRPVLLGPLTFLNLARRPDVLWNDSLLLQLTEIYCEVLANLKSAGAQTVQIDEPCLSLDLTDNAKHSLLKVYESLAQCSVDIAVASYFGPLRDNLKTAFMLPVNTLHLDLVRGAEDLPEVLAHLPKHMKLSAGLVDGRNIWRCNLEQTAKTLELITDKLGPERVIVAPSCSLLHVPVDLQAETRLDSRLRGILSFACQKLEEVSILTDDICCGRKEVLTELESNKAALLVAETWTERHNPELRQRLCKLTADMQQRRNPFPERKLAQARTLDLPLIPVTTIGSFPQTEQIRLARKKWKSGQLSDHEYDAEMQNEIRNNISIQEELGIDVFVHGEPERNDMVEYFADQLKGFAFTQNGWVQSYGSRCVKPPIIFGDVLREKAMTVRWATFAQSLTSKHVKGMLTGPVTMLKWAFVRDDQPLQETCRQLALAIRDEVCDLEAAGIKIIQIDEPAIREGMPLRQAEWQDYLNWAVSCFRLAASGVADETQIHTHMCYSEFDDILQAIIDMDADVVSVEAARSKMALLNSLRTKDYPNEIGPGVYDIHSPRIAKQDEMTSLLEVALQVVPADRLWANPDCGLKTRNWDEVKPSLKALVEAAAAVRRIAQKQHSLARA